MVTATTRAKKSEHRPTLESSLRKADEIIPEVSPLLRAFVYSRLPPPAADDVLQETLIAVAKGLDSVTATSQKQFLAWCYQIANFKISDSLRSKYREHAEPLDPKVIESIVEAGSDNAGLTPGVKDDLDYLLSLVRAAKFPCDEILWDSMVLGLEDDEIGSVYGISEAAARMKILRCLRAARLIAKRHR